MNSPPPRAKNERRAPVPQQQPFPLLLLLRPPGRNFSHGTVVPCRCESEGWVSSGAPLIIQPFYFRVFLRKPFWNSSCKLLCAESDSRVDGVGGLTVEGARKRRRKKFNYYLHQHRRNKNLWRRRGCRSWRKIDIHQCLLKQFRLQSRPPWRGYFSQERLLCWKLV